MKVLVIISPQCERAIAVAVSLGEPVALAIAADDKVFAGQALPEGVEAEPCASDCTRACSKKGRSQPPLTESPAVPEVTGNAVVEWSLAEVSLVAGELPAPQLQVSAQSQRRHRPRLFIGAEALVERLRRDGLD